MEIQRIEKKQAIILLLAFLYCCVQKVTGLHKCIYMLLPLHFLSLGML